MFSEGRYLTALVLGAISALLVGETAWAQHGPFAGDTARGGLGVHLATAVPSGDLRRNLETRAGIGGFLTLLLNDAGTLGLRVDGSYYFLGENNRTTSVAVPGAIAPIRYEITTRADMFEFTIGPQLFKRFGRVVPYVTVGAGPAHVSTTEDVKTLIGSDSGETIASTSLAGNWSSAWQVGGGFYVDIGGGGFLGLAVYYLDAGDFRYIPPGSVGRGPDGTTTFSVLETDMRYLVVQINLSGWHGI